MRQIKRDLVKLQAFTLQHHFHLRPELEITLGLPGDLDCEEAFRLGHLIQGLAYAQDSCNDELVPHRLPIRENEIVVFQLPLNLSEFEACRLNEFIGALPFS